MSAALDERRPRPIRRILVALDASPSSIEALDLSARLAAVLDAELEGLFVEDSDLLSFAELPFASLTSAHFAARQQMAPAELARSLRSQAQRARAAIERAGSGAGVKYSFRVVRGNVHREVMLAAGKADLLSLGSIGGSATRRRSGGSVAHCAARVAPGPVLILRQTSWPPGATVVALCGGDEPSAEVLEPAAQAATALSRPLVVMLPRAEGKREGFATQAREIVKPWSAALRWVAPEGGGPRARLAEAVLSAQGGLVVFDAERSGLQQEQIERLIDAGACSLLIVRPLRG
jgi:nucleotide-binding universal stress UspA family protein